MISSNTRASRSASRYSSPAQPGSARDSNRPLEPSKSSANDGPKTFLQRWLEPDLQSKPSFEEAGLVRQGVLDGMAPLGALPKTKKVSGDGVTPPIRRIILKPSGASAALPAAVSPADGPSEQGHGDDRLPAAAASSPLSCPPLPSAPRSQRKSSAPAHKTRTEEEEDEEYDPKEGQQRRTRSRGGVALTMKKSTATVESSPQQQSRPRRRSSTSTVPKPSTPLDQQRSEDEQHRVTERVVATAVEEALKHYRYPTAWALRTLWDEKSGEAEFVAMMEDVFGQTADEVTMREFRRQMETRKREGKVDDDGPCYGTVAPGSQGRFSPRKPVAAPYADLIHQTEELAGEEETSGRAAKRAKTLQVVTTAGGEAQGPGDTAAAAAHADTMGQRRARRDSANSSSSSLSSAPSMPSLEAKKPKTKAKAKLRPSRAQHSLTGTAQPITAAGRSSKHAVVPSSSRSNSPTTTNTTTNTTTTTLVHQKSGSNDASMPGRVLAALDSALNPSSKAKAAAAGGRHAPPGSLMSQEHNDDENLIITDRRDHARKVTNSCHAEESAVRGPDVDSHVTPSRTTRRSRNSLAAAPVTARATRSAGKRPHGDVVAEKGPSPVPFSLPRDRTPSVASRAATPPPLHPAKRQKTGLRIKSSPVKKKGGSAAGIPRPNYDIHASMVNGIASRDPTAENDENCSACGNAGDVVCCDGCPRSFHFECVDMIQSDDLPDEWFCNECLFRRYPSRVPVHRGILGGALNNLAKSNPRAFSLPKRIQTRFEGVKARADGDYEEAVSTKTAKKRNGFEELPDLFKQREDGQAVLCHACQRAATEMRAIIPCSTCPYYWHLDCLDPPLAVPPVLKTWRCPAHVDNDLIGVASLAPAHRFRRIKGNPVISPAVPRGLKNNGYIEIDWNDEPEEPDNSGWHDVRSFGRTYKLPAKGVVLDFIEQLRNRGAGHGPRQRRAELCTQRPPSTQLGLSRDSPPRDGSTRELHVSGRNLQELQASLNLVGLRQQQQQPSDGLHHLTSALLAAADPSILSLIAKSNAENIASGQLTDLDTLSLRAMLAQAEAVTSRIRQLLGDQEVAPAPFAFKAEPLSSPVTASNGFTPLDAGKLEQLPPVTEPTPPSTVDHAEGSMEID